MDKKTEAILEKHGYRRSSIIRIMTDIQEEYNYLPQENLTYVSRRLKIPLSKIFSIATFYAAFSLYPRGKHLVTVCSGTACFVRGVENVLSRIEDRLGIKAGSTTPDNLFTLETVNCLGACALAPIVVVDGEYYGQATVQKIDTILDKYRNEENSETTH
ncbi:MAG: NAD(P)H-dependent oxidoreductase subunit E [Candidatus Aminicenantes bacterium]|nr:NAD(P)H-dependent oxidoreductase subunit E [Candidatus Aminicenantes bacterium]